MTEVRHGMVHRIYDVQTTLASRECRAWARGHDQGAIGDIK